MDCRLLLLSLFLGLVKSYSENNYYFENNKYCDDLSPYFGEINLDKVSGAWYGVEKIHHNKGEYKIERSSECFIINIKELYTESTPPPQYGYGDRTFTNYQYSSPSYMLTTSPYVNRGFGQPERYRMRHFVLEWHESIWQDEYHIKVNTSHKGFWPTDVPNSAVEKQYRFFGGVIQVLTVSHNYLVLNFCMRLPHSQHFSVILSRHERQLTPEDLTSIHNIFTIKHLSTSSLKRVCGNSAASFGISSSLLVLTWFFLWKLHD